MAFAIIGEQGPVFIMPCSAKVLKVLAVLVAAGLLGIASLLWQIIAFAAHLVGLAVASPIFSFSLSLCLSIALFVCLVSFICLIVRKLGGAHFFSAVMGAKWNISSK